MSGLAKVRVVSKDNSRSRRPFVLAITAGFVILLATILYLRDAGAPEPAARVIERQTEPAGAAARADRLSRLRELHERSQTAPGADSAGGTMQVPAGTGVTADTNRIRPRPASNSANREMVESASPHEIPFDDDPDDIPSLRQMALHETDPERRLAAVTLLGASDDPQAIPILAEALRDEDEEVRLAAIQSLADVTGDVPVDVLGNAALNDPSAENRYEALEVLVDAAGPAARPFLEKAALDPDEDVSEFAKNQLEAEDEDLNEEGSP